MLLLIDGGAMLADVACMLKLLFVLVAMSLLQVPLCACLLLLIACCPRGAAQRWVLIDWCDLGGLGKG